MATYAKIGGRTVLKTERALTETELESWVAITSDRDEDSPWQVALSDGTWDTTIATELAYKLAEVDDEYNEQLQDIASQILAAKSSDGDSESANVSALQSQYSALTDEYLAAQAAVVTEVSE